MNGFLKKGLSIRVTVVSVFICGILMTAAVAISLQYFFTSRIASEAIASYATSLSENTQDKVASLSLKAEHAVEVLARNAPLVQSTAINKSAVNKLFTSILDHNIEFYAIYIGMENGDFYELINLESSPAIREQMGARLTDRYAQVEVKGAGKERAKYIQFLDESLTPSHQRIENSDYDPRKRVWYQIADNLGVTKSKPYLFQNLQSPGQTYSMQIDDTKSVIAIDIALSTMSSFLSSQTEHNALIKNSEIYLFSDSGEVFASNLAGEEESSHQLAPLELSWGETVFLGRLGTVRISNEKDWAPLDYSVSGDPRGYIVELSQMLAASLGISIEYVNGFSWSELIGHFHSEDIEVLTPVYLTESNQHWGVFSDPIIHMPLVLAVPEGEPEYQRLSELQGKTIAIPAGWSVIPEIKKTFPEITVLETEDIISALKAVQAGDADAAMETEIVLTYTLDIYYLNGFKLLTDFTIEPLAFDGSLHYVFHSKHQQLNALFNRALATLTADDRAYLEDKWLKNIHELKKSHSTTVPYPQLLSLVDTPVLHGKLQRMSLGGKDKFVFVAPQHNTDDQYFAIVLDAERILAQSRNNVYTSILITTALILLLLPLCWLLANPIVRPIRQLAIENEKIMRRQFSQVQNTPSMIKEIDELSVSLVDMAEAISHHHEQQQKLLDSFVETIAQAIDDKSPYTGGHCHRVPELGLMLAEQASNSAAAYFSEFSLEDEDKLREFKLAAWLHDCGKITTPECIVDKGSKLETNYNRIHEIRMRFEVLRRDAQIDFYQQLLEQPEKADLLQASLDQRLSDLEAQFTFVAECNVGGEFMADDKIEQLQLIAKQTWLRHYDDRAGLSPLEELRPAGTEQALPVTESLIMDKEGHKIAWIRKPEYDDKLNIQLTPTELQNNLGELYNLSIKKGTLNAEERFRINEHIISTIKILDKLPFPAELSNVARYASTHHETLIGTGYPRQLTEQDLSIGERILALADIFEALTASDRPYKKAKTLSEALKIMTFMVKDQHLDKEIFTLFIRSGIYLRYAKQFLAPAQMDEVDESQYILD